MERFLDPKSVVLIGVSRKSGVGAYNNLEMMERYGFRGDIYVVHPKVKEILGHATYPSLTDLPVVPELAIISVGRDRVPGVFDQCAEKGIRRVVIISQGFADADRRGKELQEQIKKTADRHRMRVLGPNTMGILNAFAGFSTAFIDLPRPADPPPLSVVAQTGVLQVGFESFTEGIGKAIDIGNGCDIDFVDALNYLEKDPQTRIIVLHMEGMKRGRLFLEVAARVARSKPVIVFKTGRSVEGAQAALSHTGSLVGEDAVFDAAFARAGLVRVRNMVELKAVCTGLLKWHTIEGPNLGVITATGACGIMTADACEDYGLRLAPFPPGAGRRLENERVSWHQLNNPVDIWPLGMVSGSFTEVLQNTAFTLLESDQVHSLFIIAPIMASALHDNLRLKSTLVQIQSGNVASKPIALWIYGDGIDTEKEELAGIDNLALFDSIDQALMAIGGLWRCHEGRRRREQDPVPVNPEAMATADKLPRGVLGAERAAALLTAYDIEPAPQAVTSKVEQALQFARSYGYPVVLKILSEHYLHKSELGGIALDLADAGQLQAAYQRLLEHFQRQSADATLDGLLVQKQLKGKELLLGIKRDPQFGAVLAVGLGGIYTEVFKDVSRSLVPVSADQARRLLGELRSYPLLRGVRGERPVAMDALVEMIVRLSRLAAEHPEIAELDLNPVIADESGCRVVDVRVIVG